MNMLLSGFEKASLEQFKWSRRNETDIDFCRNFSFALS